MLATLAILSALAQSIMATAPSVPCLQVPACPSTSTIQYSKSVPDLSPFPLTQVDLCYNPTTISLTFTAYNETNFFFNSSYGTNDPIYEYEVMETFIYRGTNDPSTYLEFEVAPNNVTWQAFVYNPSKVRTEGAPFSPYFITDPVTDGLVASTSLNREAQTWVSDVEVPLALFNVDEGEAKGTKWRMNFFRIVVSPETFPNQFLGAWSPPDEASFHKTPFFGEVEFV